MDVPDPAELPPHDPVYHSHVAPEPSVPPLTVKVTLSPAQIGFDPALAEVGAVDSCPPSFVINDSVSSEST